MTPADGGDSCQNCRHKREVETVVGEWVSLTEPHCARFVSWSRDRVRGEVVRPLPCQYAMDTFCGLAFWQPTLATRVKRMLGLA